MSLLCRQRRRERCGGALAVGLAAGELPTLKHVHMQPALERRLGLGDACGLHNLHGMPAVLTAYCDRPCDSIL